MLKQIGKYTISERIGRGTYSRVYRAIDAQGRTVAIKVSTTRTEPEHLNEFQRNLVAAASVLHPNLVAVHDLGFEDDFPYLIMELVEGRDLDKLLKSNTAPSLAERIGVMQQIGGALKAAHERGVFHLDVRPSKIMLSEDGVAKLLDLGLGRLSFDPARVTEHGYLVGAPFYMSPERLTAIDTADERCDIWSFGVAFYEWVSGRHPFYDDDGDHMIGNIMDAVPEELINVPPALNHAILHALEKDPADRYQHFGEFLADLQPLVSNLKREESDALMAEALKQTDSGRWHEARRIARQMRDLEPQQAASSQMFGFSEQEPEREKVAERARPASAPPIAAPMQPLVAAAAASATATAVDTPEPAPPPVAISQPAPVIQPMSAVAAPAKPQRPERTAPKLPPMGVRNGAAASGENGSSSASARVQAPPVPASNGAHIAATAEAAASVSSAAAKPAVVREMETARMRPASSPRTAPAAQPTVAPQQTVRILEIEESQGFPWVKILGFAIPALLMLAVALFFFLKPAGGFLKTSSSSEDAKEVSSASRVIKPNQSGATATPATAAAPLSAASSGVNGQPDAAAATVAPTTDPLNPVTPKAFDPKSLAIPKEVTPPKRRGNGAMAGLAPPSLAGGGDVTETATLPVSLNAPPPPAPVVVPPPAAAAASVPSSTPAVTTTQTVEAVRESASHVGGSFTQPILVHTVKVIYPPAAVQRRTQGTVRFQATITKDGSVKNIQLLSGDPLLNMAARQAVLQYKYRPAMLNGEAVEVTQQIELKFNLSQQ